MNEVSCRIFQIFEQPLTDKGLPLDVMIAGTSVNMATLRSKEARIDWHEFVAIMNNMRPHFTDDEYREIGRQHMRSPPLRFAAVIGRLLFSAMDFYRWQSKPRGVGSQLFSCIIPHHVELAKNEIQLDLTMPEGFEVCWDFYLVTSGNMEELPALLGLPRSKVTLTPIPRGGRFHIVVPDRTPLFARVWRILTWPFTVRAAARELRDAHETLIERYLEIEEAKAKLDRQATQLRIAHSVNDLVQRELDLVRTLDTMAKALVDEAGFAWAEISLRASETTPPSAARAARFGAEDQGPPLERALTARGGEVIGDLRIALKPDANREERQELLAFIVPTLALALQNALSYQALADYRAGLEKLVDQRTSELRQARDQLTGTVAELREAQGARERFFGNISHEIRTPLSLILLAAADIQARAGSLLDARARDDLGAVTNAAHKLVRLVDELLLLAASQEDKLRTVPERIDLAALVNATVAAWRSPAEAAGLTLNARIAAPVIAFVDPVAIERVASNLVSNAVKYTPKGGTVEIELADEPDGLRLSVIDTGPGISDELRGRLFGRFERAHDEAHRKTGTGLGLFVAKQLVEAHSGTIAALPRAGGGSEFRVVLPAAIALRDGGVRPSSAPLLKIVEAPDEPAPVAVPTVFTPTGTSLGTILLAEDDVRLAEMIARGLADDYTVVVAHDGATALELVPSHQPEMLITDVDMPTINGIELAKRFRDATGDRLAPIIVLSAMFDAGTRLAGLEAGAVDYVTKPFDPIELRARIRAQFRMRELAVRLQRAEQLSAMGILTAGLAHELRNPANGIVNAVGPLADLLPKDLVRPETPIGQLIEVLTGCADQIAFLARQLLGFRKGIVELDLRQIPVHELIQRAVSLAHAGSVEIRIDEACDGQLKCAPPLLLQVLTNLIENAVYAAGPGGWTQLRTSANGDKLTLEVSDSGDGVPKQLRERIFEPFFTTKPAGIGTGLGLSLARDIVHRHGGELVIRDRAGRSFFAVELPHYSAFDAAAKPSIMRSSRLR